MNIQPTQLVAEIPVKVWKKRLSWALPLFFLIKGLLWLAVPFVSVIYVFD